MKKANCKESLAEAPEVELVVAVQQIDQDIQQRVKMLIQNNDMPELQEKIGLCLQVERNNWRTKMQSVFRQLDNEHKKNQRTKNELLDVITSQKNRVGKFSTIFEEEIDIKDIIKCLKEMIIDMKKCNLKLSQDLDSVTKSNNFNSVVTKKEVQNDVYQLKTIQCANQIFPISDQLEPIENNPCCKFKNWYQYKSLACLEFESQQIFKEQFKERFLNNKTILKVPARPDLSHKILLSNQESMNTKCKEHITIPNVKTNFVKSLMNTHGMMKMKSQVLKPSTKGYRGGGGGRVKVNNPKREILQCHQINGYDLKTDHKKQIFQERFFCKLVANGPIPNAFLGRCNKTKIFKK